MTLRTFLGGALMLALLWALLLACGAASGAPDFKDVRYVGIARIVEGFNVKDFYDTDSSMWIDTHKWYRYARVKIHRIGYRPSGYSISLELSNSVPDSLTSQTGGR